MPRPRFVLARTLGLAPGQGTRDAARVRTLAEQARDGFAKLHDQPRIDEAAALLAKIR